MQLAALPQTLPCHWLHEAPPNTHPGGSWRCSCNHHYNNNTNKACHQRHINRTSVRSSVRPSLLPTTLALYMLANRQSVCGARIGRHRCHCCFIHYYLLWSLLLYFVLLQHAFARSIDIWSNAFILCWQGAREISKMHDVFVGSAAATPQQLRAIQVERTLMHTHTEVWWYMIPIGSAVVTAAHVQCCDLQHSRRVIGGWHCVESWLKVGLLLLLLPLLLSFAVVTIVRFCNNSACNAAHFTALAFCYYSALLPFGMFL